MSDLFLEELGLPAPDVSLGVGSGSQAVQTGRILMAFEEVCLQKQPSLVVVAGDVNSTLACALAGQQAPHSGRARRSRPSILRSRNAGRNQPRPHDHSPISTLY